MLDIYILEKNSNDYERLKELCVAYLIKKNYDADIYTYSDKKTESAAIYIFCFNSDTEKLSRAVRIANSGSYVIVIVNSVNELTKAVTPGISPSGIMIKPCTKENLNSILDEIYSDHFRSGISRRYGMFVFKLKAKEYSIPYERILFFEGRNKKIVVRTETQELEYYGTLEAVLNSAPECFMKIHKSFVVNTERIITANYGEMTVEFDDGSSAFISRTYKSELRERLSWRCME